MAPTPLATPAIPDLTGIGAVSDVELLRLGSVIAAGRRAWDVAAATVAAEVARRSTVAAGYEGLAQRSGARTPEALVARVTGSTVAGARESIRVGGMLAGGAPWLAGVAGAVSRGELSVPAADAIGRGLGDPGAEVAADDLADAAEVLLERAGMLPVEQLFAAARDARDALDVAGVADRERRQFEARYLRLTPLPDGMTRIHGLLDPESAAIVRTVFDPLTSPRRGGPRFTDPAGKARARRIVEDPRTTGQIVHDEFVRMARESRDGTRDRQTVPAPISTVVIHVTDADLQRRAGVGRLEDGTAVSMGTVARHLCTSPVVPIRFDPSGTPLDKGRTQRLFDRNQRLALAARWGGCAVDSCDRPASWCEAHHIDFWTAHHGKTDVRDGILLCRFHHLLLHNTGWTIDRTRPIWRMLPPAGDPIARPHDLIPKHPLTHRRQ